MARNSERSPWGSKPPYIMLSDAFLLAEGIYEHGGGVASKSLLSRLMGNSSSSSSFQRKVSALKGFGLLVQPSPEDFALTELGSSIAAPTNPETAPFAKKESFLCQDVFKRIFERHKGKLLPADEFLKNIVEQDFRMPRQHSPSWVDAFKNGLRAAGLAYDRGDGRVQILEDPVVQLAVSVSSNMGTMTDEEEPQKTLKTAEPQPLLEPPLTTSGHNSRIELSGKRFAVFSIPDSLTPRDAQKLKATLVGLSAIIDSMVFEEE